MSKGWQGNFFEDFRPGQELVCPVPRTLGAGDVALYIALTGDRTPAFCGPDAPLHPLVVFHAAFGQTVRTISLNARANLGYAGVVWGAPVYPGDTVTTSLRIVGLKENSSGTTGVVYVDNTAVNQRGETVLSFQRWVMINKRDKAPTVYLDAPVVPKFASAVAVDTLCAQPGLPTALYPNPIRSGGCFAFEDYQVGEVIHHFDGMQVNPSDHMAFTRLFQNSAKVHFDGHGMGGRPLVYGGVVISDAYAMAFNGLENRLGICAINGGQHVNPTYAGDTLYALTEVLATAEKSAEVGLLRLRMLVWKNLDRATPLSELAPVGADGKVALASSVVLSLDYWEPVLRRSVLGEG
jgi:2-methylfumaryl-CoA hydratase